LGRGDRRHRAQDPRDAKADQAAHGRYSRIDEKFSMSEIRKDRQSWTVAPVTPDGILQLAHAFQGAKTLLSAVELGVFAALVGGPLKLEPLRKRIQISERATRDFLDSLVALGMLVRADDGNYANTAETD